MNGLQLGKTNKGSYDCAIKKEKEEVSCYSKTYPASFLHM